MSENENNTEELGEGSRSILLSLTSQLTKGTDLHRVTLPTFVLEPRSMLERITDFMAHPELILPISHINDPIERFIAVVKWFLSGWHIKPKGVKKPYNPVLGEFFRCQYDLSDGTKGYYIAEQVSHHPPASAYFYTIPHHQIVITGELKPRSRFYGTSVASLMQGTVHLILPHEEYQIKMPNMYARNIVFGTMTLELGDTSTVRCVKHDLICEMEFQTKGFFSGQVNTVLGKIKRESTQEILYEIQGQWSGEIFIKPYNGQDKTSGISGLLSLGRSKEINKGELWVDVRQFKPTALIVKEIESQEEKESRRLWAGLTEGIKSNDQEKATDEKLKVEDAERVLRKERELNNTPVQFRFFDFDGEEAKFKLLNQLNFDQPDEVCKVLERLY